MALLNKIGLGMPPSPFYHIEHGVPVLTTSPSLTQAAGSALAKVIVTVIPAVVPFIPGDGGDTTAKTNAEDPNGFTWAVLNENDVFLLGFDPIQGNYAFEHEDRMPFSPFTRKLATVDNALLLVLMLKAWKDPAAFKEVTKLMGEYMRSCASIIGDITSCGKTSYAANTNALMLAASVLHRMGFLDNAGVVRVQEHLRSVFDKLFEKAFFESAVTGVTTLVEGSKTGEGSMAGLPALLAMIK